MEIRPVFTILKRAAVLLFLSCCPIVNAQKRFPIGAEVWGGYSYLRFEATKLGFNDQLNLNGWNGGATLPDLYEGLGVAVDISGHYTGEMEEYNFLIGPQYSYKFKGVRFYGHGLFGKARDRLRQPGTTNLEPSDLHKAVAFGGGADLDCRCHCLPPCFHADCLRRRQQFFYSSPFGVCSRRTNQRGGTANQEYRRVPNHPRIAFCFWERAVECDRASVKQISLCCQPERRHHIAVHH